MESMDRDVQWLPPAPTGPPVPVVEAPVGGPFEPERKPLLKRLLGGLAVIGAALAKFAGTLKAGLLLLPKLKILTTSGSMLVSVAAYSLIWGWRFAIGFVLLLLVHEMGHVIQLRREGIKASAPMFIPFLGAYVAMKELPKDAAAEARVGLAGPVLGTIGCLIPAAFWVGTGSDFWQACTFVGLFLNLFNLLPVLPLDGGRAMQAVSSWIWAIGFLLFIAVAVIYPSPV